VRYTVAVSTANVLFWEGGVRGGNPFSLLNPKNGCNHTFHFHFFTSRRVWNWFWCITELSESPFFWFLIKGSWLEKSWKKWKSGFKVQVLVLFSLDLVVCGRFWKVLKWFAKIHWEEWWESCVGWCRSGFTPKFLFGVYSELIFQTESSYFLCPQFSLILNYVNDLCAKWWSFGLCWSVFLFQWKNFSAWWLMVGGLKTCFTAKVLSSSSCGIHCGYICRRFGEFRGCLIRISQIIDCFHGFVVM